MTAVEDEAFKGSNPALMVICGMDYLDTHGFDGVVKLR